MKALDFYSGVGGWSFGLKLAGIEVANSFEIDADANATNALNNCHECSELDILALQLVDIPTDIDVIVGSPPCTEFSLSNRGGNGQISHGLDHVRKFLQIVDYVKPKWWVFENVPRSMRFIEKEFEEDGLFHDFKHLNPKFRVFSMENYGVPQRRKRALVGNINFDLLASYSDLFEVLSLEKVITSLSGADVVDPTYGVKFKRTKISDHLLEPSLNSEEERINRHSKTIHPIYNKMNFPEDESKPCRTLTATCTRVSRESIIIKDRRKKESLRRLTIRERASIQGFPINYQFFAKSYSKKIKLIGNAIPPSFSYLIAAAIQDVSIHELKSLDNIPEKQFNYTKKVNSIKFNRIQKFPVDRTFRFAIKNLHLGSGVRFEFSNKPRNEGYLNWKCDFFFGNSKQIFSAPLGKKLLNKILPILPNDYIDEYSKNIKNLKSIITDIDDIELQKVWSHRGPGRHRPFDILDSISEAAGVIIDSVNLSQSIWPKKIVLEYIKYWENSLEEDHSNLLHEKIMNNANIVAAGLLVCSEVNSIFTKKSSEISDTLLSKEIKSNKLKIAL